MPAQRMYTLTFDVEYRPKSLSVAGGGSHTIRTPISALSSNHPTV
jgi:hypothetical protein